MNGFRSREYSSSLPKLQEAPIFTFPIRGRELNLDSSQKGNVPMNRRRCCENPWGGRESVGGSNAEVLGHHSLPLL